MEFDAVLLPSRRERMIAQGLWHDRTINHELDACVAHCPDQLALTAYRVESGTVTRLTYRELARLADRVAVGLHRLGVRHNDIVACQLPNWWQFTVVYLACSRIGAVMNPLMHIFREHELNFMLKHGEAKVLIAPKTFRNFDFEKMVKGIQPNLPHLRQIRPSHAGRLPSRVVGRLGLGARGGASLRPQASACVGPGAVDARGLRQAFLHRNGGPRCRPGRAGARWRRVY